MKSKHSNNYFKSPEPIYLSEILNPRHELYILSQIINWQEFEESEESYVTVYHTEHSMLST